MVSVCSFYTQLSMFSLHKLDKLGGCYSDLGILVVQRPK